jgi:hypothetical protein
MQLYTKSFQTPLRYESSCSIYVANQSAKLRVTPILSGKKLFAKLIEERNMANYFFPLKLTCYIAYSTAFFAWI